jgi:hypothetical protein
MTLRIRHPPGRPRERRYAFDVVFREFLGIDYEAAEDASSDHVRIDRGDGSQTVVTVDDQFFRTPDDRWLRRESLPVSPLARWRPSAGAAAAEADVPVLFASVGQPRRACDLHLPIDIFGGVFFLLSRYEEAVEGAAHDRFGRFPATASLACRESFLERPLVDEYVEILWSMLSRLQPGLRRRDQRYAVHVSHDVDVPFLGCGVPVGRLVRGAAGDLLVRRSPARAVRRLASRMLRRPDIDPGNTFAFLMEAGERAGIVADFYFMATDGACPLDATYGLEDPEIRGLFAAIHARGHRIGLHPGFETFLDAARTRDEFERLRRSCDRLGIRQDRWGGRQHYLRWRNPDTWQNWDDAGLDYDASVGFADHVGFRAGTCREFPVFNLLTSRPLELREKPLVAMDRTLLDPSYMGLSAVACRARMQGLAATCRRFGGTLSILWHNTSLLTAADRRLYADVLEAIG